MKKLISILLTFVMVLSCMSFTVSASYDAVEHANEFGEYDAADYDPFEGKDTVVVSALGGSLTIGDGTDRITYWGKVFVEKYLNAKFPGHTFVFKNAGIGGQGTDSCMLRVQMDVCSVKPDLVILEHCVNDAWRNHWGGLTQDYLHQGKRNLESEISQLMALPEVPYIMVLGLACSESTDVLVSEYKKVADNYGLPMIDANAYIYDELMAPGGELDFCALCRYKTSEEKIACPAHDIHHLITSCKECLGRLNGFVKQCSGDSSMTWQEHIPECTGTCVEDTLAAKSSCTNKNQQLIYPHNLFWNWASDGIHPNSEGSLKAYLQPLVDYVEENGAAAFKKPDPDAQRMYTETTTPKGLNNLYAFKMQDIALGTNWSEGDGYTDSNGFTVPNYTTSTIGAKQSFKFHGNTLAFIGPRDTNLGKFKVTIDEGTENEIIKEHTQYYKTSLGFSNKTYYSSSFGGLTDGWHTATIENIDASDTDATSNTTMLAYYFTNTATPKPFADYVVVNESEVAVEDGKFVIPDGTKNVSVYLFGPYDNPTEATATLTLNGREIPATIVYDEEQNAYNITIEDGAKIEYNTVFSVTDLMFNGKGTEDIEITFATKSGVRFDSLSFTDVDGGRFDSLDDTSVTFKMKGYNENLADENMVLVMVQKDKYNCIKSISTKGALLKSGKKVDITNNLTLRNATSSDVIEIFAWKKGVLKPYTEKIVYSLSSFSFTSTGSNVGLFFADPIILDNAVKGVSMKRTERSLVISGTSSKNTVTITVVDKNGKLLLVDQMNNDYNGNFEFKCKMNGYTGFDDYITTIQSVDL